MFGGVGDSIDVLFKFGKWYLIFSFPLVVWKIVEIIIWIFQNVRIDLGGH